MRVIGVALSVNNDGIYVQLGAGNKRQLSAVTIIQQTINDSDTNTDSFKDILEVTSGNMRQRAKAPVNTPAPSVCAKAISIVPAARAWCRGIRVAKC